MAAVATAVAPAFATNIAATSIPATYVGGNVSRTVVMERYAVNTPKTVAVPRTQIEARTVVVPRQFTYGELKHYTVPRTFTTQELKVGLRDDKVTVPKTILEDSTTTVQVPRTALRDQEILVPKVIMVKQTIKVPYGYLESQQVPIKVPRVVPEQVPIKVPVHYTVPRQHVVNEVRTTVVPRVQTYQEQHVQYTPRTVVDTAVVNEQQIIERPRVYEQEAPRVIQQVIPGAARSYYGASRVAGYTSTGFTNFGATAFGATAIAGRTVVPTAFGTRFF